MPLEMNMGGWEATIRGIVDQHLSPAAERIADASNDDMMADPPPGWNASEQQLSEGYRAGTEGVPSRQLHKRDYRATVITATYEAMADNAAHNRLVNNFGLAEGL